MPETPAKKVDKIDFVKLYKESPEVFNLLMDSIRSAGTVLMFNRLSVEQEIQWDHVPYVFPPHKVVAVPADAARHAITHSSCFYIGKDGDEDVEFEDWYLVPFGYKSFCIPFDEKVEDQILNPNRYLNLEGESQYLPPEGRNGQPLKWKRVKYRSQRPRNGAKPLIHHDGMNAVFSAVGG